MSEVEKVFLGNVRRQFMAEEQKAKTNNDPMQLGLIEHWVESALKDFQFWREVVDRLNDIRHGKEKRIAVSRQYKEWSRKFVASLNEGVVIYDYTQKGVPAKGCCGSFDVYDKNDFLNLFYGMSYTFSERYASFIVRFSIQRYIERIFNECSVDDFCLEMSE